MIRAILQAVIQYHSEGGRKECRNEVGGGGGQQQKKNLFSPIQLWGTKVDITDCIWKCQQNKLCSKW